MLASVDRLRRMRDFALLSQKGRPVFGPFFTMRFRVSQSPTKIGFVCSKKIFKRAHDRNFVKRRLRDALRQVKADWPKQMDILFVAKPETKTADFQELLKSVKRSFEKIPEAMTRPPRPKAMKAKRKTSVVFRTEAP